MQTAISTVDAVFEHGVCRLLTNACEFPSITRVTSPRHADAVLLLIVPGRDNG